MGIKQKSSSYTVHFAERFQRLLADLWSCVEPVSSQTAKTECFSGRFPSPVVTLNSQIDGLFDTTDSFFFFFYTSFRIGRKRHQANINPRCERWMLTSTYKISEITSCTECPWHPPFSHLISEHLHANPKTCQSQRFNRFKGKT